MLYFHCKECISRDKADKIAVRSIDPQTIEVVCQAHAKVMLVGRFTIAGDVPFQDDDCASCAPENVS